MKYGEVCSEGKLRYVEVTLGTVMHGELQSGEIP